MHSTASDGTDAPQALPELARDAGLEAIALTDHDTTAGLAACAAAARRVGIHFIPGIELSADPASIHPEDERSGGPSRSAGARRARGTLHILGYYVRDDDAELLRLRERLINARDERNPQMVRRLNELGVKIAYEEVIAAAAGSNAPAVAGAFEAQVTSQSSLIVGRPHIAQVMLAKGYVKSIHEAFARYLGEGGAAHIRKDRLSAADAIDAIHHAGGLALLAHPVQLRLDRVGDLEHVVQQLVRLGLDGIETRHSDHTAADTEAFEQLARRFDLLTSGGSDYHGSRKAVPLNNARVPLRVYDQLHDAWSTRQSGALASK